MEADISIWRKPGHFYFALTRSRARLSPQNENILFVQSRNVRFHGWPRAPWKRSEHAADVRAE